MDIVIIEDDQSIRENLKEILEAYHFNVRAYSDSLQALSGIQDQQPGLVLCDIMMPQMDGYEVLKTMKSKETTANIPFIFLTAKVERADQRKGMEMGADDYLMKPFTSQELINAINTRIQKQKNTESQIQTALYQKLEQLASINSHEYNTPLNGIIGLAETLVDSNKELSKDEIVKIGQAIRTSAKRLHRTFRNLVRYILIQRGELKSSLQMIDSHWLHGFLKTTTTEKAFKFNRLSQTEFKYQVKDDFGIKLAKDDLVYILEELIWNALKFSEANTKVSVEANGDRSGFIIHISNSYADAGFFEHAAPFVQFNREQKEQQGTGLGLYLSKKTASINGWELKASHQNNTVTLSLEVKA